MTFSESVRQDLGRKYLFVFKGRASRSEFWWFMLFIMLVNTAAGFIAGMFPPGMASSLILIISLLLFPPNLGVTVRRLHDRNLKGWWILLPLTPLIFWILNGAYAAPPDMTLSMLSLGLCLCYLIILCLPGTKGENRFGPEPL